jgi:hypothetical protein
MNQAARTIKARRAVAAQARALIPHYETSRFSMDLGVISRMDLGVIGREHDCVSWTEIGGPASIMWLIRIGVAQTHHFRAMQPTASRASCGCRQSRIEDCG